MSATVPQVTGMTLEEILADINGVEFASIDTITTVTLNKTTGGRGTPANPHYGRVLKRCESMSVMVYTHKTSNAYENMVKRRLAKEGQDPEQFELSERKWGERVGDSCFIKHVKDGVEKRYLEVIFLHGPKHVEYLLDGKRIAKEDVIGLKEAAVNPDSQGGLEDKVILRTYSVESVKRIRTDKKEYLL